MRDKLSTSQSLNTRLGLTETSLLGAQSVTVAMVQSTQLTTDIPNNLPNSTEIGQPDSYEYQDNREDYPYQVDGTMDRHTLTDHSTDDEDAEPDNNTCKRQRKTYGPTDMNRKKLTKKRQEELLKNQQEKDRTQAQALENRNKRDKCKKNETQTSTTQPEDNRDKTDDTNNPTGRNTKIKQSEAEQATAPDEIGCKLCKLVFPLIMHGSFPWFSCFLFCCVQSVCWLGGIVVRGCASSLLGSYIHQELI